MASAFDNLKMKDVQATIKDMATVGNLKSITSSIGHGDGHAQGSNYYVDKKGRKYFIVSHDSTYAEKNGKGFLMVFPDSPEVIKPYDIKTPKGYNHPGSFQIIGDYLFLPLENYDSSAKKQPEGSCVVVYDLTPLADNQPPTIYNSKEFFEHRAGMLGVTKEWMAIQDGSTLHLYHINNLNASAFYVTYYGSQTIEDHQAIGLIEEAGKGNGEGALYMVGLISNQKTLITTFHDAVNLVQIIPNSNEDSFTILQKFCFDVSTDHGNGTGGVAGIHFRYGGGVYLYENAGKVHAICLGTGRDLNDHKRFNYNEFPTQDRIEIISKQHPLKDQEHRSSENFAMKGFKKYSRIKFTIYKDGAEDTKGKISFKIYEDVPGGRDDNVYDNVKNGNVRYDSEESPLYIHDPNPKDENAEFKVVIEGTSEPHNEILEQNASET